MAKSLKKTTDVAAFTMRVDADEYAAFAAICALKRSSVTDVLRGFISSYVDEHKELLNLDALKAGENKR